VVDELMDSSSSITTRRYQTPPSGLDARTIMPASPFATPSDSGPDARTILPANPFASLSDSALAGFVDCTLYEADDARAFPKVLASGSTRWWAVVALAALVLIVLAQLQLR
jgi:hypothetical protein